MKKVIWVLCVGVLAGMGLVPTTVCAQPQPAPPSSTYSRTDVTVFAVSRSTTRATLGWSVAHFWRPEAGLESEVTHGDDVLTVGASLRQEFDTHSRIRLALTFGGGASVTVRQVAQ